MIDFTAINSDTLAVLPTLLDRWAPGGHTLGREYVLRNPTRKDRSMGSFRINLVTGRWADFATGDAGGDVIALAAYLYNLPQTEAAKCIANMLGIAQGDTRP